MTRLTIGRLPYAAIAILLAGLTLGLIFLGFTIGLGIYSFAFLAVPFGLAIWYMAEYAAQPEPTPSTAPTTASADFPPEEAFEDPVIEADMFDSLGEADQDVVAAESARPPPP